MVVSSATTLCIHALPCVYAQDTATTTCPLGLPPEPARPVRYNHIVHQVGFFSDQNEHFIGQNGTELPKMTILLVRISLH